MFNPLRNLKRRSHKVHIWTMLQTKQAVRYKFSHEKWMFITETAVKVTLTHEYRFLVIAVNIAALCCHKLSPICVLKSYISRDFWLTLSSRLKSVCFVQPRHCNAKYNVLDNNFEYVIWSNLNIHLCSFCGCF